MSPLVNPMHLKPRARLLHWKHLNLKQIYSVELIQPYKAIIDYFNDHSGYLIIAAEIKKEVACRVGTLFKGEQVILSFPIKTYQSAWFSQSINLQRQFKEEDNLLVKLTKETRQSLLFSYAERCQPTEEQLKFSHEVYVEKVHQTHNQDKPRMVTKRSADVL